MKWTRLAIQLVLLAIVIYLGYLLYNSLMEPQRYATIKQKREQVIINKLMKIKELEIEYKVINNRYTGSFDTLKQFFLTGQMPVVLKKGSNDTLTEEKALELGLISRDTTYIFIKDTLFKNDENFNINTIDIVPFTNGKKKFELKAGTVERSNFQVPVFEVRCYMKDYLADIPQQDILKNQIIIIEQDEKFPGLILGSMDEPTTDGNWNSL